jgi:aminoglycoside 6'-N-acetyltransferase I
MTTPRFADRRDWSEWLRMRLALWPELPPEQHQQEMGQIFRDTERQAVLVYQREAGGLCGFLEASLRDYAEGCETSPVGYIEGWFVDSDQRRSGVGGLLVRAAEAWAATKGCREMASDCLIDNQVSLTAHLSLGFEEVERVILFRKDLDLS